MIAPSYGFPVVSSHQTPSEAVTLESQSFEPQQEHSQTENGYQSAQPANHNEDIGYQSAQPANQNEVNSYQSAQPANHNEAIGYQSAQPTNHNEAGMVHQPGLSLIQPHAPAQFIQSNTTPEPMANQSYLGIHQQEPAEYCHQSVISHTEHLRHPPPVESYQYSGETANHSTCMYRQHPMEQVNGQIGNQRLLHQTISQNGKLGKSKCEHIFYYYPLAIAVITQNCWVSQCTTLSDSKVLFSEEETEVFLKCICLEKYEFVAVSVKIANQNCCP